MPTLPLYTPAAHPHAWHQVTAPGGYEWWHFDAEDAGGDLRIEVDFFDGAAFDPRYVRRYATYLRNPTRVPPPTPREYPCVRCRVYERGRMIAHLTQEFPAGTLAASVDGRGVKIGPNRIRVEDGGDALSLELSSTPAPENAAARQKAQTTIEASLSFRRRFSYAPVERELLPREVSGAEHWWVISRPLCDVEGHIRIGGGGARERTISFHGLGYQDQHYGTGPVVAGLRYWMWGRVLTEGGAIAFHHAVPSDAAEPVVFHLTEADSQAIRSHERPRPPKIDLQRFSSRSVQYPEVLELREGLVLRHPAVFDASCPFRAALSYDVTDAGRKATALCHVVSPRRLASPMLRRIMDRLISRRGRGT